VALADAENAKMAHLYNEHVLGKKRVEELVSLDAIKHAPALRCGPNSR
jgi:hypothetical protein